MDDSERVSNPIFDAMRREDPPCLSDDSVAADGGSATPASFPLRPSVRLVYPDDCLRVSQQCDACVCLLLLRDCKYCRSFWSVWSSFCSKLDSVLAVHCECSHTREHASSLLVGGSDNPSRHTTFPAVLVCCDGKAITLPVHSKTPLHQLQFHALRVLSAQLKEADYPSDEEVEARAGEAEREAEREEETVLLNDPDDPEGPEGPDGPDDEPTPLESLPMHEVEWGWGEGEEEEEEEEVEGGCACSSSGSSSDDEGWGDDAEWSESEDGEESEKEDAEERGASLNAHGVRVTHLVSPSAVMDIASGSANGRRVCVLFYADWCGHCHSFKPEWNACVEKGGGHAWCAVDGGSDEGRAIADREGVRGFPTVHIHHRGSRLDYDGPRTAAALYSFVHG